VGNTPPTPRAKDTRRLERTSVPGVYRRGNSYVVVGRDHRGRQIKRHAATLAEARDKKAALRTDVRRGEYRATSRMRFVEYAERWADTFNGKKDRGLKPQTLADYKAAIKRREFSDHFGRLLVSEVEASDLREYAEKLKRKGLSPRTIRNALLPIRLCLAQAVDDKLIRSNPAAGLRIAAAQGTGANGVKVNYLKFEQAAALLRAFDELADETEPKSVIRAETFREVRFLTDFLLLTGCRVGEALALRWDDFDAKCASVRIDRRVYKGTVDTPKSRYGRRTVPVAAQLRRQLRERRKRAGEADPVFRAGGGSPLDYTTATRAFRKAADRVGLTWATIHTCRHTLASWLLRPAPDGLGALAQEAQVWLGHHSASFTIDTYGHLVDMPLPSADELGRRLWGNGRGNKTHRDPPKDQPKRRPKTAAKA
jgi:integrase